jgi:hypothetical protein
MIRITFAGSFQEIDGDLILTPPDAALSGLIVGKRGFGRLL